MIPFLDKLLKKSISKKLLVFLLATILMFLMKITGEQWVNVAMVYIGTQGAVDFIKELRTK